MPRVTFCLTAKEVLKAQLVKIEAELGEGKA